jgi:chromate transporter
VEKRKWLDDKAYTDLVALCNFLPGPASSQIGIALGTLKAGLPGGFAAWLGFTTPSALALLLFAYGFTAFGLSADAGWIHGLKIVAVAVVAQAVWGMGKTLCPDRLRADTRNRGDSHRVRMAFRVGSDTCNRPRRTGWLALPATSDAAST